MTHIYTHTLLWELGGNQGTSQDSHFREFNSKHCSKPTHNINLTGPNIKKIIVCFSRLTNISVQYHSFDTGSRPLASKLKCHKVKI